MCIDIDSSSGGADSGGYDRRLTLGSNKRLKSQKVPRRGPGVAELEKILRERVKKVSANMEEQSYTATPISLNRQDSLAPNVAHFSQPPSPPMNSFYGDGSSSMILGKRGGDGDCGALCEVGGSGISSPKKPLFEAKWGHSKSNMDQLDGTKPDFNTRTPLPTYIFNESNATLASPNFQQRVYGQCPPATVNHTFRGSAPQSLSTTSSAGTDHHIEAPSNQTSHIYASLSPLDAKVVGMKRQRTFSVDDSPDSQFYFPVPPVANASINKQDRSSYNCTALNLDTSNIISRFLRGHSPPDTNSNKCITFNIGAPDKHWYTSDSPILTSAARQRLQKGFGKFDELPIQKESTDNSRQKSGRGESYRREPYKGFLQSKERTGSEELGLSLNIQRDKEGDNAIDLNLKL